VLGVAADDQSDEAAVRRCDRKVGQVLPLHPFDGVAAG